MRHIYVEDPIIEEELLDIEEIPLPAFVAEDQKERLKNMVHAYARLFLLENSMRGLIEHVLSEKFGENWWDQASNSAMKRKHGSRKKAERDNKWAPARTEFGPLYALDWSDLITIMRKYQELFVDYFPDPDFLH